MPQVKLEIGPGCDDLMADPFPLEIMGYELIQNCAQKPEPGVEIQASLFFDPDGNQYCFQVEDNVQYPPGKLTSILKNLSRRNPQPICKDVSIEGGGLGLRQIRNLMDRLGGKLEHKPSEDGRIIARVTWPR